MYTECLHTKYIPHLDKRLYTGFELTFQARIMKNCMVKIY